MRALLAYLFSIAIFIGGGYAGLVWLTNPPTEGTVQSASSQSKKSGVTTKETKTRAHDTTAGASKKAAVKPLEDEPVDAISSGAQVTDRNIALELPGGKAGAEVKPADKATAAAEQPLSQQSNVPDAPSAQTLIGKTDNRPAKGCMPIGLTAQGQLVFPMQCREVLEHDRATIKEVRPSTGEPAQTQTGARAQSAPPVHETAAKKESAKSLAAQGDGVNQNLPSSASIENAAVRPETVSKNDTKTVPENADPQAKENKVESPKQRRASRSKPVMMILRTIEFPDGHREQRLLPMNPSRKIASQSEDSWFSPLTFR